MNEWDASDGADVDRAPICPSCGVTALVAETTTGFVCENPDCDAFGELISD
ncbi:MAG TPA: hypothetical protein VMW08_10485 [Acidimicrobiales bacterium]|nr:hypothetical protein [Acidimicrobiales bacterium]